MGLRPSLEKRLTRTAHALAGAVRAQESAELARLVADTGEARPADVGFRQPELLYWRTDGGRRRGSLSEIRRYYQGLGQGRLVVVGPAGSGKTVLAIQLVRDLAMRAAESADGGSAPGLGDGGKRIPVPVRLSAPTFDPTAGTDPADVVAGEVAARLDAWVAEQLSTVYGVKRQQALRLVAGGWVLPVLDGVDEMDPPGQPPRRAAALLAALNQPTAAGLRPVVLTCRTDRYTQLSTGQDAASDRQVVQDATVVEVEPLTAAAARQYLIYRFPDPAGSDYGEPRWRPLLDRLANDREHDPVVAALRSPLRLFLAIAGFRAPATQPDELTSYRDAASLDDHLFGLLVPAATAHYPRPGGGRYPPEQVTRWLATLARHLRKEDLAGRSGTDLLLHELWTAAGQRLPRYLSALIITVTSAAVALGIWINDPVVELDWRLRIDLLLFDVGLVAMTAWRSSKPTTVLRRFDPGVVRIARIRRQLAVGLVIASASAALAIVAWADGWTAAAALALVGGWAAAELPSELVGGVAIWVGLGVMFGLPFGLVRALEARPQAIDVPRQLVSQGITHTAGILVVGLTPMLWGVLATVLDGPVLTPVPAAVLAAVLALVLIGLVVVLAPVLVPVLGLVLAAVTVTAPDFMIGLLLGLLVVATSPWPRYLVACLLLARRHELPHRPAVFLDWAYEAGLMRLAGIAVQFRHREFQDWLTRRCAPEAVATPASD